MPHRKSVYEQAGLLLELEKSFVGEMLYMEPKVLELSETLPELKHQVSACENCTLSQTRTQIVFGSGHLNADLMFVGEAPGKDEDLSGEPFVGRSGKLLTKMIEAMGLSRDEIFIANILKCRPPENRNPSPFEIEQCSPYLKQQIALIKPKVICALGSFAAHTLLKSDVPISQLRGKVYTYENVALIPTFHPAYLLRNGTKKKEAWEDLQMAMELLKA